MIFNDGGTQQFPGSRQPGLDYAGGTVSWDGSSTALTAITCDTTVPVSSVSISRDGVSNGKLSLKAGASAQLTATVLPENATDRKVTWTSSDSSVANAMGTGVVTAAGKAGTGYSITASAVQGARPCGVRYRPERDRGHHLQGVRRPEGRRDSVRGGRLGPGQRVEQHRGVRLAGGGASSTGTVQVRKGRAVTGPPGQGSTPAGRDHVGQEIGDVVGDRRRSVQDRRPGGTTLRLPDRGRHLSTRGG